MRSTDDLLTVTEAAAEIGVPTRTLHYWITSGKVAAQRVGSGKTNPYVLARADVEQLRDERAEASA